ncbi:hypothetical protein E1A91_D05G057000v1 [Gossypium mustelinum]|uniref:Uncharacterized protein n=1 Tax=Gossypium mustelinum TaxID=34275 RepID=A0A5D2UU80_GOSMU|nr:hypothetical protein E1A91_D05G057000v1 [Gossypium mustelinum]
MPSPQGSNLVGKEKHLFTCKVSNPFSEVQLSKLWPVLEKGHPALDLDTTFTASI